MSPPASATREPALRTARSERLEALGELAAGVAHDFNNLLFITLGNLQMLQRLSAVREDQQAATFVNRAVEGAERSAVILRALLSFARDQQTDVTLVDVRGFLDGLAPLLRQGLGQAHTLTITTDSVDGLHVFADPSRLSCSLLNLVFNARDAMKAPGRLEIVASNAMVSVRPGSVPERVVSITVRDTGHGIPAHVLDRVFEPYFTTKDAGRGTGLGLAAVSDFAQRAGGCATMESIEGTGTTVTVHLPAASADTRQVHA